MKLKIEVDGEAASCVIEEPYPTGGVNMQDMFEAISALAPEVKVVKVFWWEMGELVRRDVKDMRV